MSAGTMDSTAARSGTTTGLQTRSQLPPMARYPQIPAPLRLVMLARAAEGWSAARIAAWLAEKHGLRVTARTVLSALNQASAERADVAKAVVREYMRAELPGALAELAELRSRAKAYEAEARLARDWAAVRGSMAEQRGAIGIVLRYSGAGEPEELSVEASALVRAELEAALDRLEEGLDPDTFSRVLALLAQPVPSSSDNPPCSK